MTKRTYLPYDVARCIGTDADQCQSCARRYFAVNGQRTQYMSWIEPEHEGDKCPNNISMEIPE